VAALVRPARRDPGPGAAAGMAAPAWHLGPAAGLAALVRPLGAAPAPGAAAGVVAPGRPPGAAAGLAALLKNAGTQVGPSCPPLHRSVDSSSAEAPAYSLPWWQQLVRVLKVLPRQVVVP